MEASYYNEVRQELIEKYVSAGNTFEVAEAEVDAFLSDTQRSSDYLEMRLRAKEESDLGFEEIVRYALAFTIGILTNLAAKYYLAFSTVSDN